MNEVNKYIHKIAWEQSISERLRLDYISFTIVAGALILSVTFVSNHVGDLSYTHWLIGAWFALVMSTLSLLLAYFTALENLDDIMKAAKVNRYIAGEDVSTRWNAATIYLNLIHLILLISGIVLLSVFFMKNIENLIG